MSFFSRLFKTKSPEFEQLPADIKPPTSADKKRDAEQEQRYISKISARSRVDRKYAQLLKCVEACKGSYYRFYIDCTFEAAIYKERLEADGYFAKVTTLTERFEDEFISSSAIDVTW